MHTAPKNSLSFIARAFLCVNVFTSNTARDINLSGVSYASSSPIVFALSGLSFSKNSNT